MNRIFFTGMAAFLLLSLFVCGQNKSSIVLYRENIYQGSVVTYKINVNDTLLIRLKNASFSHLMRHLAIMPSGSIIQDNRI